MNPQVGDYITFHYAHAVFRRVRSKAKQPKSGPVLLQTQNPYSTSVTTSTSTTTAMVWSYSSPMTSMIMPNGVYVSGIIKRKVRSIDINGNCFVIVKKAIVAIKASDIISHEKATKTFKVDISSTQLQSDLRIGKIKITPEIEELFNVIQQLSNGAVRFKLS